MANREDLTAFKRTPWGGATGEGDLVLLGVDYSAAAFLMQIRWREGDAGTAILTLANASAGIQGISATYDAGYLHPDTGAVMGATIIRRQIDEAAMEAIALASPANVTLNLKHDMHATPVGLPKSVIVYGDFFIKPGVTI